MEPYKIDTKAICEAILKVRPDKKVRYRGNDFIVIFGNPIFIEGNHAKGNPGEFYFNSTKDFLHGLCSNMKLFLNGYEFNKVLDYYDEMRIPSPYRTK
jgi:hypothetical protein